MPTRFACFLLLFAVDALAQAPCLDFPSNFVPFTSVLYETPLNNAGDSLVVGVPAPGLAAQLNAIAQPSGGNQRFCNAQVRLAPNNAYPGVYVPTGAERGGDFREFNGLLTDPQTNRPFAGGVIPANRLNGIFAWRFHPVETGASNGAWSLTGTMSLVRGNHQAVLLPSGKVFIVGSGPTAELYDPATGTFTAAGRPIFNHGGWVSATVLNDGRVLLVGGGATPRSAEIYDPFTGQFQNTGQPIQPHGYYHTATLLKDGRVLVVGGLIGTGSGGLESDTNAGAEVYDPRSGVFTRTANMMTVRNLHTATLLDDGRVLVTGGYSRGAAAPGGTQFDSAEIYNPTTATFSFAGNMSITRAAHFAVRLTDGKVLIGGGDFDKTSAELFNPVTGHFTPTGSMVNESRSVAVATLLSSGQVLVAGGQNSRAFTNAAELYNPGTGTFSATGAMRYPRFSAAITPLLDGRVLVTGGGISRAAGTASAEFYTPVIQGLVTSQSGLTFRAAQGSSATTQNVLVLSPVDSIPFTVSTRTFQGGDAWLSATASVGTVDPTKAPVNLAIRVNPQALPAADYYGLVTLTPTDNVHPPVSIAIVLTITPPGTPAPPGVAPSGFVFVSPPKGSPAAQTFTITNVTSSTISFAGTGAATPAFFDFLPKSGSIASGQSASVRVTPSTGDLTNGVYRGAITLLFNDRSTQVVDLLLVISDTATTSAGAAKDLPRSADPVCAPTKLLPVFTSIGNGFTAPIAWPAPLVVRVVDDCGSSQNTGTVTANFTNGDPPINLIALGGGNWSGTWVPGRTSADLSVRADARRLTLTGSVLVKGASAANPNVPIVAAGSVVNAGDFSSTQASGLLVSIFGASLADGTAAAGSAPLPEQLGSTSVLLAGRALPLTFVSESQVNALIPYETSLNTTLQLVVQRANALSVPAAVQVFDSAPAILTATGTGTGQALVYRAAADGSVSLADSRSPAEAGNVLVAYVVGLGAVTPAVASGSAAPTDTLSTVSGSASMTVGGVPATVRFAGLTPGFVGLYQVNATMPSGVTVGERVPVVVSVNGRSSSGDTYIAVR